MKNKLLNFRHTREVAQKVKMKELAKIGACPFCPKYLKPRKMPKSVNCQQQELLRQGFQNECFENFLV